MEVVSQLEGAFALLIRSTRFPDELMAAKKGSPLLVGERPEPLPCCCYWCKLLRACVPVSPLECRDCRQMLIYISLASLQGWWSSRR